MSKRKKPLPDIQKILARLEKELNCRYFTISQIPEAVTWAERGNVSIHENFHSRRKQSYHVISGSKEAIEAFCNFVGIPLDAIKASEFYRFWHVNWTL
ncbi:hypothetical protein DBT_1129 [Dissulfuribacter thermophilus]|uniref:Uncharacterized protein n=1 Tax=Dissulfuribacter thermophilus TaxID=1156395 RepID=A0A1B9F637_9BACT|nr:hypothetical protein [Dissulfuribacter thermophilus]OCC15382.1 hypothetical protein DBT_1129 [Dissulfuribacter thermophilus]